MKKKLKLGLMASGSGTDAAAIAAACRDGRIRNAEPVVLVSTKTGAGCLARAAKYAVASAVIERKGTKLPDWREALEQELRRREVEMVFLVGCVVVFKPIAGIVFYNIHPADPRQHGGCKMCGLAVHKHVLTEIRDEIKRGWKKVDGRFFTLVTVHEVIDEPDQGEILCQLRVEIPKAIIGRLVEGKTRIGKLAKRLQKHVLPYEWQLLPMAVEVAVKRYLDLES